MRIIIAIVVLFVVVILGAVLIATPTPAPTPSPTPENGAEPFVSENVIVTDPLPNATVPQTFTVRGQARGNWFFEALFPLQVRDPDNNNVGGGVAMARDNWMTTEFVPFEGKVIVENYSGPARLVLLRDNPSGLPENEDSVEFPIVIQ